MKPRSKEYRLGCILKLERTWPELGGCRSPQSNGLVESFFGSFKRDYLSHQPLETLADALKLIPTWITHYNEVAPHSALAMLAPATFYQQSLTESQTKTT